MIRKVNKFVGEFVIKKAEVIEASEPDPRLDIDELTINGWKWPAYGTPLIEPKTSPDGIDVDDL